MTAEPFGEQLELVLRVPSGHGEGAVPVGQDPIAATAQVQVVWCLWVSTDTATVGLTQEVATEFCCPGNVSNVLTQSVVQKCLDFGTVVLRGQRNFQEVKTVALNCRELGVKLAGKYMCVLKRSLLNKKSM